MANAAPWSYALKLEYLKDFPEDSLWETYGSTELGVCTILRPEDQVRKPGSAGQACPLVEIRLYDDEGNIVTEPGKQGTLYVRSDSVLHTYYKAQEKFDKARKDGFMTVGDVAFADEEGYFTICDRKIDMIISGGMNIYPAEVEAALEAHEGVYDVAVFGIPSDKWGESVYALIVPAKGNPADEETLTAYARERLASYKIPRFYAFADEIPRNASGKILKRQLREKFGKKS